MRLHKTDPPEHCRGSQNAHHILWDTIFCFQVIVFKHASQKHMQVVNSCVHTAWCFFWQKCFPQRNKTPTRTHHGPYIYLKRITSIIRSFILNLFVASSVLRRLIFASSLVSQLLKPSFEELRAVFSLCAETSHIIRGDSTASFT